MKEFKRCNVSAIPKSSTCGVRATLRLLRFWLFLFLIDPRMTQFYAYSLAARTVGRHRRQSGGTLAILSACYLTQCAGTPTLAPASRCHTRVQALKRSEESITLRPLAPPAPRLTVQVIAKIGATKTVRSASSGYEYQSRSATRKAKAPRKVPFR